MSVSPESFTGTPKSYLVQNYETGSGQSAGSRLLKQHLLVSPQQGQPRTCAPSSTKTSISWRQPQMSLRHMLVCTMSHFLVVLPFMALTWLPRTGPTLTHHEWGTAPAPSTSLNTHECPWQAPLMGDSRVGNL